MADFMAGLREITSKKHTAQAIWWLNGFWHDGADKYAETVWDATHLLIEIESGRPKLYGSKKALADVPEGNDLDEMQAHVFLEKQGETMTVRELRSRLTKMDIDKNKRMSLTEYLIAKYDKTPKQVINAPQGDTDPAKLEAAQAAVAAAAAALSAAQEEEAKALDAKKAAEAAEAALREAVAALELEQKTYDDKCAKFEREANDESTSAMKRARANNELAQLKSEDPLPLRKAKITQGAALKRSEKATKAAEQAAAAAAESRKAAEAAFDEAQNQLEDIKKQGGGVAQGAVWWMERELAERRKYMPKK